MKRREFFKNAGAVVAAGAVVPFVRSEPDEDLADVIYHVSPIDAPFKKVAEKSIMANSKMHEWVQDELVPTK